VGAAEGVLGGASRRGCSPHPRRLEQVKERCGWSSRRSAAVGAAERVLRWEQPKECCRWRSRRSAAVGAAEGALPLAQP
jgi:hypothetical protein